MRNFIFLVIALFCAVNAYAAAPAVMQVEIYIQDGLDCADGQCNNIWGECFAVVPGADGIVNVDTMPRVECADDVTKVVVLDAE